MEGRQATVDTLIDSTSRRHGGLVGPPIRERHGMLGTGAGGARRARGSAVDQLWISTQECMVGQQGFVEPE